MNIELKERHEEQPEALFYLPDGRDWIGLIPLRDLSHHPLHCR